MQSFTHYLEVAKSAYMDMFDHHPVCSVVATGIAITIPILYYLYNQNLQHWTFNLDEWSSYELEKGVRCNTKCANGVLVESLDHKVHGKGLVKTVYDCFNHGLLLSRNDKCMGRIVDNFSRYEWLTYDDVEKQARRLSHLLKVKGIKRQECIGIYAVNSPKWVIAQLSCVLQSLVTVPLYDTLGPESIRHSINEVQMPVLFCDSEDKLKKIVGDIKHFSSLKLLILLHDQVNDSTLAGDCKQAGVELMTWSQALEVGAKHSGIADDIPTPDDLFLIQYTSGTTGRSKGVMLTHRNMVADIAGAAGLSYLLEEIGEELLNSSDTVLFYLPLAHGYGQTAMVWFLHVGGKIGFSAGIVTRLVQDMQLLKPTYLPLVPRIMNRVYTKVLDETKSGFKGWLFWFCYERKKRLFQQGCICKQTIWDWLVFGKLQKMIGGNVRFMTTGSAPIGTEVLEFWRVVFGAFIMEGYGQTESTAAATGAIDIQGGQVGHPILCNYIRLLDLPELGYTNDHNPPQGEICIKGPNVMTGYYKQPELTKEAFTSDGWLMTGDIGEFCPDGSLRMIDRRKHLFKLAQGEYVAPEKIESIYAACPLVAQVFVDGNSLQPYTVAVAVPEEAASKDLAGSHGIKTSSLAELCKNEQFKKLFLNELLALGKENHLNSIEQIKSIYLHHEQFTIANGLLTPSLKNKRNDLRKRFQSQIAKLYEAGPMIASSRK